MFDRQRLISSLIALGYLSAMWRHKGWDGVIALIIPLIVALGLIWYAGTISRNSKLFSGWRGRITGPTPPAAVRALGWMLLLLPLAVIAIQWVRAA